jgi:hypothetical protein
MVWMAVSAIAVRAVLLMENNVVVIASERTPTDEYVIEIVVYSVLNCFVTVAVVVVVESEVKRAMPSMLLLSSEY